ncbi:MAG: NADH-ubiquinone oxidoreductase-F iron-sulfur binding region domain-containing protein [Vicinamibacterales bacterium]
MSGHVERPGVFEASMDVTLRQLICDYAGGMKGGRALKAIIPGGSSTPVLTPASLDVQASFDGLVKAGSMLGSAAMMVMDDTTDMVWLAENLIHFYKHESCGKCTPCREGADWMHKILRKLLAGEGAPRDIELLLSVASNIGGKTLCPFGDAEIAPVVSTIQHFRDEFEHYAREGTSKVPLADWRARAAVHAH